MKQPWEVFAYTLNNAIRDGLAQGLTPGNIMMLMSDMLGGMLKVAPDPVQMGCFREIVERVAETADFAAAIKIVETEPPPHNGRPH